MVKLKSNLNTENNLYIFVERMKELFNNEVKQIKPFYAGTTTDFDYLAESNQVLFIKNIEGICSDNKFPISVDFNTEFNEVFTFTTDLVLIKPNSDSYYKSFSELKDFAVTKISNSVNVRYARIMGWEITFSTPIININTNPLTINNFNAVFAQIINCTLNDGPLVDVILSGEPNKFINVYESDGVTLIKQWGTEVVEVGLSVGGTELFVINSNNGIAFPNDIVIEIQEGAIKQVNNQNNRLIEYSKTPFSFV